MKIYISWSRTLGYFAANELNDALLRIFDTAVTPYFSGLSIKRGSDWFTGNQWALSSCQYAIILVTRRGLSSPWLLYESGMLLNRKEVPAEIILVDVEVSELAGTPFAHFQCTDSQTQDFDQVFTRIDAELGDSLAKDIHLVTTQTGKAFSLLSKAEDSVQQYLRTSTKRDLKDRDAFLYDACVALLKAGLTEHDIESWFLADEIKLHQYANHLVMQRQRFGPLG